MKSLIQFTLLIPIHHRLREFNFRKRTDDRYDCNVADESGERFYFTLFESGGAWKIDDQLLPAWLSDHADVICESLQSHEINI